MLPEDTRALRDRTARLFGHPSARGLARLLGHKSERASQRWLSGQNRVPDNVFDSLDEAQAVADRWDPTPVLDAQGDVPDIVYAMLLRRLAAELEGGGDEE